MATSVLIVTLEYGASAMPSMTSRWIARGRIRITCRGAVEPSQGRLTGRDRPTGTGAARLAARRRRRRSRFSGLRRAAPVGVQALLERRELARGGETRALGRGAALR